MTIRQRTDSLARRRVAGGAGVIGLGAVTVVHGLWARGSSWPAADRERLADLVVGRRPFPGRTLTWIVTALLGTATGLTAARAELVPVPGGSSAGPVRIGSNLVAAALLTRGASGLAVSGLGLGHATPQYRRWDLALYSPLCLGLAAAVALASRPRSR